MGKGDIKTKRGKISNNSFGNLRPKQKDVKSEKKADQDKKPKTKNASS